MESKSRYNNVDHKFLTSNWEKPQWQQHRKTELADQPQKQLDEMQATVKKSNAIIHQIETLQ